MKYETFKKVDRIDAVILIVVLGILGYALEQHREFVTKPHVVRMSVSVAGLGVASFVDTTNKPVWIISDYQLTPRGFEIMQQSQTNWQPVYPPNSIWQSLNQ